MILWKHPSARPGLTMIEITIVILIVGILAAVSAPQYAQSVASFELESATRQMAEHLRQARRTAIDHGKTVQVKFDVSAKAYSCDDLKLVTRQDQTLNVALEEQLGSGMQLAVSFDGQTSIAFDWEGKPLVGGAALDQGSVRLDWGNHALGVAVAPGNGFVTVVEVTDLPNRQMAEGAR